MKILLACILLIFNVSFCEKTETIISNPSIIGQWQPTYEMQNLQPDSTWSEWITINTFVALPTYEFTKDGRFLLDGKFVETCCNPGSKYKHVGKILTFEYVNAPDCKTVKCADANTKTIELLDEKTLILIESSDRIKNKYRRVQN